MLFGSKKGLVWPRKAIGHWVSGVEFYIACEQAVARGVVGSDGGIADLSHPTGSRQWHAAGGGDWCGGEGLDVDG